MSIRNKLFRPSHWYSAISIAIVLFLLLVYLIVLLHASNITNLVKEKINIIVELHDEGTQSERDDVISFLKELEGVNDSTIEYIPKEDAVVAMGDFMKSLPADLEIQPFKDMLSFNLLASHYNESTIAAYKADIEKQPGVLNLYADNESVNMVKDNLQKLSYISLFVGGIFVFLSIAIIYNSVQLNLQSDKEEIKTMQLVGAKRIFIAKPYISQATVTALRAFGIAVIGVGLLVALLIMNNKSILDIVSILYMILAAIITLLVGVFLTVGITRQVVRSYLNQ